MKHYRIGDFANKAGVTVRTIRYYDRIGLLRPTSRSDANQRLYSELDFARLQQILTLKLIGLSLEEIKGLLTSAVNGISHLLERQKSVLQVKAQQLQTLIQTIERAQQVMTASQKLDLEQFVNIIRAVNMNMQSDWLSQFVSDDQHDHLVVRNGQQTFADQKQVGQEWQTLFQDVLNCLDKELCDPTVQQLVSRWDALISQFSPADSNMATALNNAYTHIGESPDFEHVGDWARNLSRAAAFIQQAREAGRS